LNLLDVIATLIILYGAFKGYKKGFFISLMGFISLYISLIIGIKYHHILILLIQKTPINLEDNALIVVSIIVSFLFSFLIILQLSKLLKYILDLTLIGFLDDLGGAFLGSLICGFILSFLFNIIDWLNVEILSDQINNSILYPIIKEIQPILTKYILLAINISPEFWDLIKNIEENKSFT
tara:strand:+ start:3736 stop:4275 length:540 start_codon:yes stop_codon:yes gene_type:complete